MDDQDIYRAVWGLTWFSATIAVVLAIGVWFAPGEEPLSQEVLRQWAFPELC